MNIVFFCLSIASRSPPTTLSGCEAKTHNLRTFTLGLCLAFHVLSCVSLIKSLNLSFLIWKMGTMKIIPPSRMHVCLQRASGPERTFWVPAATAAATLLQLWSDSVWLHRRQPTRLRHPWDYPGKNTGVGCHFLLLSLEQIWIILPPGEKEIWLEVMAAIPKAKYWFKPNGIYFWTLTQIYKPVLLFSGLPQALMITGSDYSLPQPYQSVFPCQLLLPWNHTAKKVIQALGLLSVSHISIIATSSCYGYLS